MDAVKAKLASGAYQIVENQSLTAKLVVWKKCGLIRDNESNVINGFAACKNCQKVLPFDSRKLCTLSLRKHFDSCRSTSAATVDRYLTKSSTYKPPKQEDKEAITQFAMKFVCRDIQSFETMCGDGFCELAQGLIDIGA